MRNKTQTKKKALHLMCRACELKTGGDVLSRGLTQYHPRWRA